MPPKNARIDVPAWQRSIAGFQTVCTVASTSTSTVASTSTSTCSNSHAEVANEDFPSAKKVRVYTFCDKWAKDRPWLEFRVTEDAMYCTFCEKYAAKSGNNAFRDRCKSLRLSNIKDHEKTPAHQASSQAFEVASRPLSEMPMEQCLQKMENKSFHQMEALFRSAFYLAQKGRPFSDFPDLITLQRANGLEIPITYCNDKEAHVFTHFISFALKKELIKDILKSDYISILSDGSTDSSTQEEEIVYVRYLQDNCTPKTTLLP